MPKPIALTLGKEAIEDDEDYERLIQKRWQANNPRKNFWIVRTPYRKPGSRTIHYIYMDQMILDFYGPGEVVHINGNPFDNRKSNLRIIRHQS